MKMVRPRVGKTAVKIRESGNGQSSLRPKELQMSSRAVQKPAASVFAPPHAYAQQEPAIIIHVINELRVADKRKRYAGNRQQSDGHEQIKQ